MRISTGRNPGRTGIVVLFLVGLGLIAAGPIGAEFNPKDLPPDLHTVTVQNVPMIYTDQGKGDPLIILSPYPFSTELWADLAKRLGGSGRVLVVEPPGLRDPASMKRDFSSGHLLYLYRDFVKALGLGHVHLLGVGESGGLAVAFGHHFPEITGSVVSLNGFESVNWSQEFDGTLNYFKQSAEGGMDTLLSSGSLRYRERSPSREAVEKLFVPLRDEEQKKAVLDRFKALTQDVRESYILAMLPNFNRHLLLLRSDDDQILLQGEKYLRRTRSQIRQVTVEDQVIAKAGHFAFLDQPETVAKLIGEFLAKYPISSAAPRTN